jgi:hypothetical protein
MFKILLVSIITFILVIITFLIFMSFMNVDIKTNSIEKFVDQEPTITGGGSYNKDIGYCIFTDNGTITFNSETICEVLMVGGGGGGARNDDWEGGGGGGGGGVGYGSITFSNGTYNINIGKGGNGGGINGRVDNGINGGNTTITGDLINETAYGGGGGGWRPGLTGGSGGGGSGHAGNWDGGIPNKGNSLSHFEKANIYYYGNSGGYGYNASGGGGGGGADSKGLATGNGNYSAGNGGNGKKINITGSDKYYGGGGGGASGCYQGCDKANGTNPGNGGLGGGGRGGDRNNPTNGEINTGGGGGGSSKRNGANGGSGVVIIKYKNISNVSTSSSDDISNLFSIKKPWGMYFAEDFNNIYLKDKITENNNTANRHANISGNINKLKQSGNGATGKISYITGGTGSSIIWPNGSIPANFTILSLTRYTGGSRARILSSDKKGGNWLHGHWGKNYWQGYRGRGCVHYDGWKSFWEAPNIGNLDDWLCTIGKNQDIRPENILFDGVPSGTHGSGGVGNYTLSINSNPWNENSDWALSCVIIWDQHLFNDEMQLLNRLINWYKVSGKKIIDIINKNNNSETNSGTNSNDGETKQLTEDQQFNFNNEAFNYVIQFDNQIRNNVNVRNFNKDENKKSITINFKTPFVLKKILFVANERNNAPSEWTINNLVASVSSQNYDAIQGKVENNCVVFYIDNIISTDTYNIQITNTIGGIQKYPLSFNQMILYEGITSEVISTANGSIVNSGSLPPTYK